MKIVSQKSNENKKPSKVIFYSSGEKIGEEEIKNDIDFDDFLSSALASLSLTYDNVDWKVES